MKNEKWDDVHGNTTPDDKMVAFLESPTDSYAILQLREDVDDNIPLMFANYSYLQKKEMEPEIDRYEVVYHGSISVSGDVNRQLEDLYVKFNIDHPNDFRGHSMSVSDIVALKVAGEVSFSSLRPISTNPTFTTISFIIPPRWMPHGNSKTSFFLVWRCKDLVIWFAWNTGCPLLHRSRIGSARKELFILRSVPSVMNYVMRLMRC